MIVVTCSIWLSIIIQAFIILLQIREIAIRHVIVLHIVLSIYVIFSHVKSHLIHWLNYPEARLKKSLAGYLLFRRLLC